MAGRGLNPPPGPRGSGPACAVLRPACLRQQEVGLSSSRVFTPAELSQVRARSQARVPHTGRTRTGCGPPRHLPDGEGRGTGASPPGEEGSPPQSAGRRSPGPSGQEAAPNPPTPPSCRVLLRSGPKPLQPFPGPWIRQPVPLHRPFPDAPVPYPHSGGGPGALASGTCLEGQWPQLPSATAPVGPTRRLFLRVTDRPAAPGPVLRPRVRAKTRSSENSLICTGASG